MQMANVTRFDPFTDLVDDLFKGFLVRPLAFEGRAEFGTLPRAKVDVTEKNGAYLVSAELPGVKKDDIHVTLDGAQVTLEAEVKREKEANKEGRALHTERLRLRVHLAICDGCTNFKKQMDFLRKAVKQLG